MVCHFKQAFFCATQLDLWAGVDHALFSDGSSVLLNLATRLEEEDQNGWFVLSGAIVIEFYLVTDLLWTKSTLAGINRDYSDVGIDRDDNEEVLSVIKTGLLFAGTLSAVG